VKGLSRWAATALATALPIGAGLVLARVVDVGVTIERRAPSVRDTTQYWPRNRAVPGRQIEMVFIGASTCGWSTREELAPALNKLMLTLERIANERHWSFRSVGVALDWPASDGAEYLNKMGHFDEIAAGYSWGNAQALRSIWDIPDGEPSTPQVALYTRRVVVAVDSLGPSRYAEADRSRYATAVGIKRILEWAANGGAEIEPPEEARY
jgi:hypothetical protein